MVVFNLTTAIGILPTHRYTRSNAVNYCSLSSKMWTFSQINPRLIVIGLLSFLLSILTTFPLHQISVSCHHDQCGWCYWCYCGRSSSHWCDVNVWAGCRWCARLQAAQARPRLVPRQPGQQISWCQHHHITCHLGTSPPRNQHTSAAT